MQTSKIKQYAPKARNDFIAAISKKANQLGIYRDKISAATEVGGALQIEGKSFDIAYKSRRARLINTVEKNGFDAVIEKVAYSWFNRLCAIRYMELHDYLGHGFRVLSHPEQNNSIEILDHAKDAADELGLKTDEIIDLQLAGNKEEELYRKLLLAQCHQLYKAMPFLFEPVDDETELLLPEGLTRTDSLIRKLVTAIPEEDWEEVEVIGWLYQFYISEKKDEVIGKVVKSEDIPAATQLFTPNWIVKYLVQNSVGRQWLQTYPDSSIKGEMEYYIEPAEQTDEVNRQLQAITPESINPEEIKVLDPACGSGHILVEAYSLLREIYIERGYKKKNFPQLILENNIFGLDIDDRAAQLSGFALMMKAREDDRRIFTREVELNVMSLQSTQGMTVNPDDWLVISDEQEREGLLLVIKDLLELFKQAKTFGSLIEIPEQVVEYLPTLERKIEQALESGDMFATSAAESLLPIVKQVKILAYKYDAVVANPPYMGGKGMNAELKKFAKDKYPNSKSDLFAIFMERAFKLLKENGFNAQINMQSWMFLSSYEKLRLWLLETKTFVTMAHLGARAFGQISGEVVQTTAWVLNKKYVDAYQPTFFRLIDGKEEEKRQALIAQKERYDYTQQNDFKKIPGSPISYWVSDKFRKIFNRKQLSNYLDLKAGMSTGDNERFQRYWFEVSLYRLKFDSINVTNAKESNKKWFPCNSGGTFRKWYGNNLTVVNWENDGFEIRNFRNDKGKLKSAPRNTEKYFLPGITWTKLSSGRFAARWMNSGFAFDDTGRSGFLVSNRSRELLISQMVSNLSHECLQSLAPTMSFTSKELESLPVIDGKEEQIEDKAKFLISEHKEDWDKYELSWDFKTNVLISLKKNDLSSSYNFFKQLSGDKVNACNTVENEINEIIINSSGLSNEISSKVPNEQITLMINPNYRYGNVTNEELVSRFQSETLAEFISYTIGCMMGRYSLDRAGLIYAYSSNKGFSDLEIEGVYKTFPADDDGIIPLTDLEWFDDDATYRFKEFLIAAWGEETLQANLQFVAESLTLHAIKPKKDESPLETIRRYFSTGFFKQHLKTYKKRPIYWLFSSGKQKAFEALVYLHRYNESTLARMRTEYVTPLMGKYEARADSMQQQLDTATGTESRRIEKELKTLNNKQAELRTFDDKLKHYADMQIKLDLDDGVKVNYGKFGDLLAEVKAVTGKKPGVQDSL